MTAISYHDTVNDLPEAVCWGNGPFSRQGWFALLEEAGLHPFLAVASDGDGAVCFPMMRGTRGLEPLMNWYAFTWAPCLPDAPSTRMLTELTREIAEKTHCISLRNLADEDVSTHLLEQAFRTTGWVVLREPCDINHVLRVQGRSYDQFLAGRPGNVRSTLKRKGKKISVRLTQAFDADDWSAYEDIYADSWKPAEGEPTLLCRFAQTESAAGRFRFAIAHHDDQAVAAQFWTVDGSTAYIHKLAHRQSATALSPGTTLTAALFKQVIDIDRVEMVDFGTGDQPYKRDWMEETRIRWQFTCLRPGAPQNWPTIAKAGIHKLVSRRGAG